MTWLTVIEYLCHKWSRISSTCRKHFPVLSSFTTYYRVCNYINTTGATSGTGTAYPSGAPEFTPVFSGVRVTRSLVFCVCFVDRCLSFCAFSFGHCVVCSSMYGFWLPLWYLQTLLAIASASCQLCLHSSYLQLHCCELLFTSGLCSNRLIEFLFVLFIIIL
jgi:hypothetical protein